MHYKRASDPLPFSNSIKMVFVSPVAVFAARWGGIWIRFPKERSGKVSEKAAGKVGASHPGSQTLIWHSYARVINPILREGAEKYGTRVNAH